MAVVSSFLASEREQTGNSWMQVPLKGFSGAQERPLLVSACPAGDCTTAMCPVLSLLKPPSCVSPTSGPQIICCLWRRIPLLLRAYHLLITTMSSPSSDHSFSVLYNFSTSNHSVSPMEGAQRSWVATSTVKTPKAAWVVSGLYTLGLKCIQ